MQTFDGNVISLAGNLVIKENTDLNSHKGSKTQNFFAIHPVGFEIFHVKPQNNHPNAGTRKSQGITKMHIVWLKTDAVFAVMSYQLQESDFHIIPS